MPAASTFAAAPAAHRLGSSASAGRAPAAARRGRCAAHVRGGAGRAPAGFIGFGRSGTGTDPRRMFRFRTVKPGATGDGQAPHLNVIVLMRGLLVHAYTRPYPQGDARQP